MLRLTYDKQLATLLHTSLSRLRSVCHNTPDFCEEWDLHDPSRPDKVRTVIGSTGILKVLQSRFFDRVLRRRLPFLPYSHGGVSGRSIRSNFSVHCNSRFVLKADIRNFYPSISQSAVYHLFFREFCCPPPVAALCTQLTTFRRHLAQGLVTSPILANQMLRPIDVRLGTLCHKNKLQYSRFVDDITISGRFDLQESGFEEVIRKVVDAYGFELNEKTQAGRITNGIAITGIRKNRRGHWDVQKNYIDEIEQQLEDSKRLARGMDHTPSRPYYLPSQIRGRIRFIEQINPTRGTRLLQRYRAVDWLMVEEAAHRQQLAICRKSLTRKGENPTAALAPPTGIVVVSS
jgi:RNA-directed DNA polymerase